MADQTEPSTPKELRDAYERTKQEAEEGRQAKRKLAFLEAGVDLNTPTGKLVDRAYDGDLTADGVKAFAEEMGIDLTAKPAAPPSGEGEPPDEGGKDPEPTDEDQVRRTISGAEAPDPAAQGDVLTDAFAERDRLLKEGKQRLRAGAPVLGAIIGQAAAGNKDFIYDPTTWGQDG